MHEWLNLNSEFWIYSCHVIRVGCTYALGETEHQYPFQRLLVLFCQTQISPSHRQDHSSPRTSPSSSLLSDRWGWTWIRSSCMAHSNHRSPQCRRDNAVRSYTCWGSLGSCVRRLCRWLRRLRQLRSKEQVNWWVSSFTSRFLYNAVRFARLERTL